MDAKTIIEQTLNADGVHSNEAGITACVQSDNARELVCRVLQCDRRTCGQDGCAVESDGAALRDAARCRYCNCTRYRRRAKADKAARSHIQCVAEQSV